MEKEYLYSPWRMDYIASNKSCECIFCCMRDEKDDDLNLIFHRGEHCFIVLNRYPYNNGHIMVVPNIHQPRLSLFPAEVIDELFRTVTLAEQALSNAYSCDGINIGINIGKAAGAGIEEHLHVHLVPRWNGDNNFMTVVAGQRVIPEDFSQTRDKLLRAITVLT